MSAEFIFRELGEKEVFNPLSLFPAAPFTQSAEYGEWQKSLGRVVRRFIIELENGQNGKVFGFFQTIKFPLPFGKSLVYIPYGPIIDNTSDKHIAALIPELKKYLLKVCGNENTVFVILDFSFSSTDSNEKTNTIKEIFQKYFKKTPISTYHSAYFQPRAEWYLDISDSPENLQKRMHEKTRYLINLSARKGVVTEIIDKDFKKHFEEVYFLLCGTAKRNNFSLHPKKYYENIFDCLENESKNSNAYLSIAKYDGKTLVTNLIVRYGETAHFIFGGSSDEHRNISPSHSAQWAAIKHAKTLGCKYYNFGGIAMDDKTHKNWDGLSSFKKKFGGRPVLHDFCYDLPLKPFWYALYTLRKVLHNSFGR